MKFATYKVRLNSVHRKLDWHLRRNEKIFQEAVQKWFALTVKQIQADLTKKFIKVMFIKDVASELTDWEYLRERGQDILKPATLTIMKDGGNVAYNILDIAATFDVVNVRSVKAAEKFTAKLVREVNGQTRKGIRAYIKSGIKEGKSMSKIARELRSIVGLTKLQTESVINYRSMLKAKHPELSDRDIDKRVQRYADKTRRRRMQTIARTETARAQNLGYVEGLKDSGVDEVEFSAYPGCCNYCDSLDGRIYSVGRARNLIPAHP